MILFFIINKTYFIFYNRTAAGLNTVKPAAIEINVYYNGYGNHRNNTKGTRF